MQVKIQAHWKYAGDLECGRKMVWQSPKPICKANTSLSISMSSTHWRQKSRSLTRTTTTTAAPVTTESKWKQPKQAVLHAHIQLNAVWPSERKFLPHYTVENWVDHTKPNKHTAERQIPHDSTYSKYLGSVEGKFSSETESRRVVPKVWKQMC